MRRSIGIDINKDKISIVQLCLAGGKFSLEKASVREIPERTSADKNTTTDIGALIKSMVSEDNFDVSAKVAVTAPSNRVFYQNYKTDISINEDGQRLIKYELEDDFPIPFDRLVVGICGSRDVNGSDRGYLVGAINRVDLQGRIELIKQANLKCTAITTDVCALNAVASLSCDLKDDGTSIIIHNDNSRIILIINEKGKLICVRHFDYRDSVEANGNIPLTSEQVTIREIEMTSRLISGSGGESKPRILINRNNEFFDSLSAKLSETTDYEIVTFNPFAKIDCSEQQVNSDIVIATGLALIVANEIPEFLNFLSVYEFGSDRTAETKRGLLVTGALILIIGFLLVGKLFYELYNLKNQHELVKKQIRNVFVETLPGEKKIVNELAQMNEQLEAVQAEYDILAAGLSDRILPLKVLQIISEKITPDQSVRISDISMTPGSVRLLGTAASFESVDNLMSVLRQVSEFKTIEMPGVDVDSQSSRVRFTLLITTVLK
ncbi:MAG: pilus assembly protein PilM [Sedimentisphaerales bacterium]|nr:pilus assembly protein PilM [Sedimentisphaerales bacterium]